MIFQGCCFKNVGVAGYVEAFEMVQLENQASYMGYLFRNRCTRIKKTKIYIGALYFHTGLFFGSMSSVGVRGAVHPHQH